VTQAYQQFLESKAPRALERGMTTMPAISSKLFPFQRHCVEFMLRVGSSGLFLDTGLGKTLVQLEYCEHARHEGNGKALILAPLAVAGQIAREGVKFGYDMRWIRDQSEAGEGINVCNYDRLHLLDTTAFDVVSLDEASILKSFTGKTTAALIQAFNGMRFKAAATATPAPNDHMELGQYAQFLEIMASNEMLARWFISDQTEMGRYRLKGHAVTNFWDWMASWCRLAQLPSDLGGDDTGFVLPPLSIHRHRAAESAPIITDGLFAADVLSATNMHQVKRTTAANRAKIAADLAMADNEPCVIWCDTDYESDAIMSAMGDTPSVVEVRGSMSMDLKERNLDAFATGGARVLVSKPSICGFGMNFQHCASTVFVGRSFSYESWYQAVRRFWRFGQKRPVNVHLVVAEGEDSIARVIDRKASDHASMKAAMKAAMIRNAGRSSATKVTYDPKYRGSVPSWLNA
jgi:hypothetical protein